MTRPIALLVLFIVALPGFAAGDKISVTEVLIAETEPGIGLYHSRLLLSDQFLRLDDGQDDGDYILFNRRSHEIHSINHEDQSHLIMKPISAKAIDFKLDFKVEQKAVKDAPSVGGIEPIQHQYFADTRLCKQSINVKGLLPQVTQALMDYEQALAAQNSQTLNRVPADMRSSCYMANNYLHASDYLTGGFPLFVMDDMGRQKKLEDFHQREVPASLFEPISGYKVYYPNAANLEQ